MHAQSSAAQARAARKSKAAERAADIKRWHEEVPTRKRYEPTGPLSAELVSRNLGWMVNVNGAWYRNAWHAFCELGLAADGATVKQARAFSRSLKSIKSVAVQWRGQDLVFSMR